MLIMLLESSCLYLKKNKIPLPFKGNQYATHNDQNP